VPARPCSAGCGVALERSPIQSAAGKRSAGQPGGPSFRKLIVTARPVPPASPPQAGALPAVAVSGRPQHQENRRRRLCRLGQRQPPGEGGATRGVHGIATPRRMSRLPATASASWLATHAATGGAPAKSALRFLQHVGAGQRVFSSRALPRKHFASRPQLRKAQARCSGLAIATATGRFR